MKTQPQPSRQDRKWTNLVAVAALAAATFAIARAEANRMRPIEPAVVATVDIERIFRDMKAGNDADTELQSTAVALDADLQAAREEIQLLTEDLELFNPGSAEYLEADQNRARKAYQYRALEEFAARKLDAAKSKALLSLYGGIREQIAEVAEQFNYDLVFVDDSVVPLPTGGTEKEMMIQISARRMLYASERIDITDLVLARMNG